MNRITTWGIVFLLLVPALQLAGCGQVPLISSRAVEIEGLIIANSTPEAIYDVQLKVGNTNTLVTCSYLSPKGKFTTAFPLKTYQGNPVTATWTTQSRQTLSCRPVHARLPENLDYTKTYLAVVEIKPRGVVDVYLMVNE